MKRILFEVIIFICLITTFVEEWYMLLPNPIQLVGLKMLLVSMAIIHAHIIGKLFFEEKIDWSRPIHSQKGAYYARVGLYIIIPLCYAFGG